MIYFFWKIVHTYKITKETPVNRGISTALETSFVPTGDKLYSEFPVSPFLYGSSI